MCWLPRHHFHEHLLVQYLFRCVMTWNTWLSAVDMKGRGSMSLDFWRYWASIWRMGWLRFNSELLAGCIRVLLNVFIFLIPIIPDRLLDSATLRKNSPVYLSFSAFLTLSRLKLLRLKQTILIMLRSRCTISRLRRLPTLYFPEAIYPCSLPHSRSFPLSSAIG